ncbi:MAG: hypothetical protein ACOYOK_12845, partial [Pseudobdellovibrionaceae bacterium]
FELKELSISMSTELGSIKQQAKDLRSHPAWKFSSKKDLSALERKMQKPFLDQLNRLNEDISEMLFVREQMKQRSAQPEPPMKRRKSSQRKTAKSKGFNHQQMSFGDL